MISLISSLSLNLYLNSLVYHRNIFVSTTKVFGNLRKSRDIFRNFRRVYENVPERSCGLRNNLENLRKSSESDRKIFGKSSVCLCNKDHYTLARRYEFYDLVARTISRSFAALTCEILFLPFISSCHRVISSIGYIILSILNRWEHEH